MKFLAEKISIVIDTALPDSYNYLGKGDQMNYLTQVADIYKDELETLETSGDIITAKRYLKYLDDLTDEGYTALKNRTESEFHGYSRLRKIIHDGGDAPFEVTPHGENTSFDAEPVPLSEYLETLLSKSAKYRPSDMPAAIHETRRFAEYLKNLDRPGTAYVFLLRDTLLPYLIFASDARFRGRIFPLMIGRKFLRIVTASDGFDDLLREPITDAARDNNLLSSCLPRMRDILSSYPALRTALEEMLSAVDANRIIAVESGAHGTIPLTLAAADKRIVPRMYTAVPFLSRALGEMCFTGRYEELRGIETLTCHDRLFTLDDYRDGKFTVRGTTDNNVIEEAMSEISAATM